MYFWTKEIAVGSSVCKIAANSGLFSGVIVCGSVFFDDSDELEEDSEELEDDLVSIEEELEFSFFLLTSWFFSSFLKVW